jgi:hypothetical protein
MWLNLAYSLAWQRIFPRVQSLSLKRPFHVTSLRIPSLLAVSLGRPQQAIRLRSVRASAAGDSPGLRASAAGDSSELRASAAGDSPELRTSAAGDSPSPRTSAIGDSPKTPASGDSPRTPAAGDSPRSGPSRFSPLLISWQLVHVGRVYKLRSFPAGSRQGAQGGLRPGITSSAAL